MHNDQAKALGGNKHAPPSTYDLTREETHERLEILAVSCSSTLLSGPVAPFATSSLHILVSTICSSPRFFVSLHAATRPPLGSGPASNPSAPEDTLSEMAGLKAWDVQRAWEARPVASALK